MELDRLQEYGIYSYYHSSMEEEYNHPNRNITTCNDAGSLDVYPIHSYLRGLSFRSEQGEEYESVSDFERKQRLVFYVATRSHRYQAFAYHRSRIEDNIEERLFIPCQDPKRYTRVLYELVLDSPLYVYLEDLLGAILESGQQSFVLVPTEIVEEQTESYGIFMGESQEGGHHCGDDNAKQIYRIFPISSDHPYQFTAMEHPLPPLDENEKVFLRHVIEERHERQRQEHVYQNIVRTMLRDENMNQIPEHMDDRFMYDSASTEYRIRNRQDVERIHHPTEIKRLVIEGDIEVDLSRFPHITSLCLEADQYSYELDFSQCQELRDLELTNYNHMFFGRDLPRLRMLHIKGLLHDADVSQCPTLHTIVVEAFSEDDPYVTLRVPDRLLDEVENFSEFVSIL